MSELGRRTEIWISSVSAVAWLVVYCWLLVQPDRRGIHDLWSGTIVVENQPLRRRLESTPDRR